MKKTKRKASRLTGKSTDEEVIRWTKSHDVFDRLEQAYLMSSRITAIWTRFFEKQFSRTIPRQLNMRLPPAMKAVLSKLARQRTTDATTLARIWLAERLERELKAG